MADGKTEPRVVIPRKLMTRQVGGNGSPPVPLQQPPCPKPFYVVDEGLDFGTYGSLSIPNVNPHLASHVFNEDERPLQTVSGSREPVPKQMSVSQLADSFYLFDWSINHMSAEQKQVRHRELEQKYRDSGECFVRGENGEAVRYETAAEFVQRVSHARTSDDIESGRMSAQEMNQLAQFMLMNTPFLISYTRRYVPNVPADEYASYEAKQAFERVQAAEGKQLSVGEQKLLSLDKSIAYQAGLLSLPAGYEAQLQSLRAKQGQLRDAHMTETTVDDLSEMIYRNDAKNVSIKGIQRPYRPVGLNQIEPMSMDGMSMDIEK